jgi:hypothetical protein
MMLNPKNSSEGTLPDDAAKKSLPAWSSLSILTDKRTRSIAPRSQGMNLHNSVPSRRHFAKHNTIVDMIVHDVNKKWVNRFCHAVEPMSRDYSWSFWCPVNR